MFYKRQARAELSLQRWLGALINISIIYIANLSEAHY